MGIQKKKIMKEILRAMKKGSKSSPYVPLVIKENPINRLPSLAFWSAHLKNGHFPAIYIGMTEARSVSQAKVRILKEWTGQFEAIEQIKSGKFKLLVRKLGLKKAL